MSSLGLPATAAADPRTDLAPGCRSWAAPFVQSCQVPAHDDGLGEFPVLIRPATDTPNAPVVLFLDGLHVRGGVNGWIRDGYALDHLADTDATLIFPAGESGTLFTNWSDGPQLADFYTETLPDFLDQSFGVRRGGRGSTVVVGISAGAFGAVSLAAQKPQNVAAVVAFSGFYDTNTPGQRFVTDIRPLVDGENPPNRRRGPWNDQAARDRANPTANLSRLDMPVDIAVASGLPDGGSFDGNIPAFLQRFFLGGPLEVGSLVFTSQFAIHTHVRGKNNVRFHVDPVGTHSWDTWRRAAWEQGLVPRAIEAARGGVL